MSPLTSHGLRGCVGRLCVEWAITVELMSGPGQIPEDETHSELLKSEDAEWIHGLAIKMPLGCHFGLPMFHI